VLSIPRVSNRALEHSGRVFTACFTHLWTPLPLGVLALLVMLLVALLLVAVLL